MKFNKLALLCAVACAGLSGQAMAQVSSNATALAIVNEANGVVSPANPTGEQRILFVSGASAVQGGLGQIATTLFTGTNYLFHPSNASGRTNSDYRAYAGRLAAAAGTWPAGTAVIIVNRARGGSVIGVNPVARGESIENLAVNAASCTAGAGTGALPFLCNTLISTVPDAGVSDVAPGLFKSPINTEGEPAEPSLNATELAGLTAEPLYGLAFGLPLSNNLPLFSVNKAQVSGIMAGTVGTWNQVNASLPADDILLCRRVNGSGTQAVANLYHGNFPCGTSNTPVDRESGAAWDFTNTFVVEGDTGALNVVENSSSGNVRSCLNNAVTASTAPFNAGATPGTFTVTNNVGTWSGTVGYTTYVTADRAGNPVGVAMRNGRPHKAIGVLSMDSLSASANGATGFSFRAYDGAGRLNNDGTVAAGSTGRLPTKASYMDGTWDQQGWISFNIPATTTGNKRALANNFKTAAKAPAVLAAQSGLALVAGSLPGTPDPTNTGNVLLAGYAGNNQCGPLAR
jgi:hypothetical protein